MRGKEPITLYEAKANFVASVDEIRPLLAVTEHPFQTLALALTVGVLAGYAGTRIVKKISSIPLLPLMALKKLL